MNAIPSPAAIILAAGASSRMGRVKALLEIDGETFIDRLDRIFHVRCGYVFIVLGHHADAIRAGAQEPENKRFVVNPDPDRGMLSSLREGLRAVPDLSLGVLFTPVDVPMPTLETVYLLADAIEAGGIDIAVPVYQGKRGHPVAISERIAREILALPPDAKVNEYLRTQTATEFPVSDEGVLIEIDTPEDYEALQCRVASVDKRDRNL